MGGVVSPKVYRAGIIVLICAVLIIPSLAAANNGLEFIGASPIQETMGGVGVASPGDTGTVASNPAGIGRVGSQVDLGFTYVHNARPKYVARGIAPGIVAYDGMEVSSEIPAAWAPYVGGTWRINDQWAVGAVLHHAGLHVSYPANVFFSPTKTMGEESFLVLGASYSPSKSLSFGIAPIIAYQQLEYKFGTLFEPEHDKAGAFGGGFVLGVMADIFPNVTVGATYQSPIWYSKLNYSTIYGRDSLRFAWPQKVGLGVAVKPVDNLKLAADVVWINWSNQYGRNKLAYTQNSSLSAPWNLSWRDQMVFKFGVEWEALKDWTLRAGVNYGRTPLNTTSAYENIGLPATTEWHYTAGVSYRISQHWSALVGYVIAPTKTVEASNPFQYLQSTTVSYKQQFLEFALTYRF